MPCPGAVGPARPTGRPRVSPAIAERAIVQWEGAGTKAGPHCPGVPTAPTGDSPAVTAASSTTPRATGERGRQLHRAYRLRPTPGDGDINGNPADDGRGGTVYDSFTVTVKAAPGGGPGHRADGPGPGGRGQ